jgi:tRNA threonylcarbamoyladenosine biosynthesis protein TsaB
MPNLTPTILSIETSSETASAALIHGTSTFQCQTDGVMNHSQSILPMVQNLLKQAGIALADCDAIAFGSGPGSFTGVRTACGVVQGLAFGADLPVIPIVTLLALAQACMEASGATNVLTALDARMVEVYWAQYRYDANAASWHTVIEPTLSAPAMVAPVPAEGLALAGNGFAAYAGQFVLAPQTLEQAQNTVAKADAVARLALTEFAAGRVLPALQAQPLYLRNKIALTVAERQALSAAASIQ